MEWDHLDPQGVVGTGEGILPHSPPQDQCGGDRLTHVIHSPQSTLATPTHYTPPAGEWVDWIEGTIRMLVQATISFWTCGLYPAHFIKKKK